MALTLKVGDSVSFNRVLGQVVNIHPNARLPIECHFEDGRTWRFTAEGKLHDNYKGVLLKKEKDLHGQ